MYHFSILNAQAPALYNTDILHYSFSIKIADTSDTIKCYADLILKVKKNLNEFSLDLEGKRTDGKGMVVSKIESKNYSFAFRQEEMKLFMFTDQLIPKETIISIRINYAGIPSDGLIISRNSFGDRTFFADNWPQRARCWLPTNDHPSDKASVDFTIEAPAHYQIIANGYFLGDSLTGNNSKLSRWKEKVRISTKVMVFGAADFAVKTDTSSTGIPVQIWVYKEDEKEGFLDYSPAKEIVDIFQKLLGPYPYEKLANVQSTTIYGGMENASCIFYTERSVTGKQKAESLLAHEIAHQWFGNSVTECDWPHLWLSEGFATYLTDMYFEQKYGLNAMLQRLSHERIDVFSWPDSKKNPVVNDKNSINIHEMLNPIVYEKGGWILHMLRGLIGDSKFKDGLRYYYQTYHDSIACSYDFQKAMESVSGLKLDTFFAQWLYHPGYPIINLNWKYDSFHKTLNVKIEQIQNDLFTFPLELGINDNKIFLNLFISGKTQELIFPMKVKPQNIQPDPFLHILALFKISDEH